MNYTIDENKLYTLFIEWKDGRYNIHLDQAKKAELIGVSQSVISRLENRTKRFGQLKSHHFINLCNGLGIHPVEILKIKTEQ